MLPPDPGPPRAEAAAASARRRSAVVYSAALVVALALALLGRRDADGITLSVAGAGAPFAFVLFSLVLLGIALFHHHTLWIALSGAAAITAYTALLVPSFIGGGGPEHPGLVGHAVHEGRHTLLNLGGLLLGFALLAKSFERSGAADSIPRILPRRPFAKGFVLLALVWILSAFLDNIAAAMIGGVVARRAFEGRVTVAYLAAIVASSNAGGAWSVLGDTTTTMMWIAKISPLKVIDAAVGSVVALGVVGVFGSLRQSRVALVAKEETGTARPIDSVQIMIVALVLLGAVSANILLELPFVGVWAAIAIGMLFRRPAWEALPHAAKGAAFLLSLVWSASLMPVRSLPDPSWPVTFGLGFLSAVFDNIPLTKLALDRGGYDWGMLAYAVGFGGSMVWFGSSAGVAISSDFPETRDTVRWVREGWFVPLAYVLGFAALLLIVGWHVS